jgi:DNA-binding transcriptional LysR family regulator
LRVGAAPLLRAGLLPAALAELCAGDPTVAVELVEGAHRELLETLLAGRLHLILGPLREAAPEGTVQHPLFLDELVIAARAGHPLAHGVARPERLLDFPWAASPIGTPRRAQWEAAMRAAGVQPPEPRLSCSSASVVRGLLLNGDWLAMLSPDQFRTERESGRLVAVPGLAPAAARRIGSTVRAGSSLDDVSTRLVAILQRLAGPRLR